MTLVTKVDELGKPAWLVLMVAGFALCWPIGLAVLAFLIGSGRFAAWRMERRGRWYNMQNGGVQNAGGCCGWGATTVKMRPSGNAAFDEYRAETLRRLEEEQREFVDYLEKLRKARDKAEFDQFMAERRRPQAPAQPEPPQSV